MNGHHQRAMLLIEQGRFSLAENEVRGALAGDPDDPSLHAMLAICLRHQEQFPEAEREARQAVGLGPDLPMTHSVLGDVLLAAGRHDEAEAATKEAISLNPEHEGHWTLLAQIHLGKRRWAEALEAADAALRIEPEDVDANNVRAVALVHLNRRDEAGQTIADTLRRQPDNTMTHANQGWTLLHANKPREALDHFREALRLDPGNEWARRGIVESLKARNIIYRMMLGWFLWMNRLSGGARKGVLIGGFVGYIVLGQVAQRQPALAIYILPLLLLYLAFVILTWISVPLFDLMLRLSRFGRHALSRNQIACSNWLMLLMAAGLAGIAAVIAGYPFPAMPFALTCAALVIPLQATFHGGMTTDRRMGWITLGLAAALIGVVAMWYRPTGAPDGAWTVLLLACYFTPIMAGRAT